MQLLIIRHAIAEDREAFAATGRDDRERPLTKAGRRKMARAAKGLRRVAPPIDVLATSPLTRAAETAAIVADEMGGLVPAMVDELAPQGKYADLLRWLRSQAEARNQAAGDAPPADAPGGGGERTAPDMTVAAVGHEPHLSGLVSLLLTGRAGAVIELKKGAACLLDLGEQPAAGKARLLWALTPVQLRRLRG